MWGKICVGRWGSYGIKYGNPLQIFKSLIQIYLLLFCCYITVKKMEDLLVYSIELDANDHTDDDHYTLWGNIGPPNSVVITPPEKINKLSKPKDIHALQKEPNTPKVATIPVLQKQPNLPKESKGIESNKNNRVTQEGGEDIFEDNVDEIDK